MATEVAAACPPQWIERYCRNLEALYLRDTKLAATIDALPFASIPAIELARDGNATAQVTADDKREIYLHSRYNPPEEARKAIAAQNNGEHVTYFLHGLGIGYPLLALEETGVQPVVFVLEPDLRLIKATLLIHDLTEMISDGRLIFFTSADTALLSERLSACNADLMLGVQSISMPIASRVGAAFHEQARRVLLDVLSVTKTHMVTLLKTSRVTFENVAMNLPAYLRTPGIEPWKDRAPGYPAIIVAAGPSLARNVRQLGELRDRAVIISVQTVFKLLHSLGIPPHFVTSLDYHDVSTEFFRGQDDVAGATLIAEPKAAWRVIDLYPGATQLVHHRFADMLLKDAAPRRGDLRPGSTVAQLALYFAEYLGCDPIIFVGQDLAFTDGMFYLPGSPVEQIWRPEMNRFQTVEMKQWERVARNRPILRRVKDVRGDDVYTDDLLFTYLQQFEQDFIRIPRKIIQATEGGAALRGCEMMPLGDAANQFCSRPLPRDWRDVAAASDGNTSAAVVQLERRVAEIREARDVSMRTRDLLAKLATLVTSPAEFNRVVGQVDAERMRMAQLNDAYQLVCEVSATAQIRRYGADRRLGKRAEETPEVARRRIQRDAEFVISFIDGCEYLLKVLGASLERLRGGPR